MENDRGEPGQPEGIESEERPELTIRDRLVLRFVDWPLIQLVVFDWRFRWLFLAVALALLAIGLSLPKVWRTSPAGFAPVVRVSVVDLVQARSLRRSAVRLAAAGRDADAAIAWQSAIANNLADPELLRGALRHSLQAKHLPPRTVAITLDMTSWLLLLTPNNQSDLELVARVYGRYGLAEYTVSLLEAKEGELSLPLEAEYMKAQILCGRAERLEGRWERVRPLLAADAELALCQVAYLAGWGPPEASAAARRQLVLAATNSDHQDLANRLQLVVCAKGLDAAGYAAAVGRLEERRADRLEDHIGYWQLLAALGRAAEARRLAREHVAGPTAPWEVVRLARVYRSLGLLDYAVEFLQRYAPVYGDAEAGWALNIWGVYADVLIENRRWEELLTVARQIRTLDRARIPLAAFSYFLEGRALYSLNRHEQAQAAFRQAAKLPWDPPMGLQAAISALKMSDATLAWDLLLPLQDRLQDNPAYWQALFEAAYARRDDQTVFKAAARAYAQLPDEPLCQNNYAAALLINRQRPDEALKLTMQLLQKDPGSPPAVVNHSMALAMNRRTREAAALLARLKPPKRDTLDATAYNLARFEISRDLGRFDEAWAALDGIKAEHLFPKQVKWLEQQRRQLPPRTPNRKE